MRDKRQKTGKERSMLAAITIIYMCPFSVMGMDYADFTAPEISLISPTSFSMAVPTTIISAPA